MAYEAIVNGARGLTFFGGHLTEVANERDARLGWNWTFWEIVLRQLLRELTSTAVGPALVAADANVGLKASAGDVELVTRRNPGFLYVIAVRTGAATSRVGFSGLPAGVSSGQVLFEYVQEPLPPPEGVGHQEFRSVTVSKGAFRDWLGPQDARVYRFAV